MAKIIRHTYPKEISIGLLLLVFAVSFFLAPQIFDLHKQEANSANIHFGTFLVSCAVIVMVLVMWEEFLFPVHVKPAPDGLVFRNHRTKLIQQTLIYLIIPIIFVFIFFRYELNMVRFVIWAAACIIIPVAGKLISGINNYNDFLKLTDKVIEYKNNAEAGTYELSSLQKIVLTRDERRVLHKIQLTLADGTDVTIDLDEMELADFMKAIDDYINAHYKSLLK